MDEEITFPPGTEVRLRNNPGRKGTVGIKTQTVAGTLRVQVNWMDNNRGYHLVSDLESIPEFEDDPLKLASEGKYGRARNLRGLLTNVRLNGRLANLIYSMEVTNTDFYAFQFRPVISFLDSPSNGLLIADEVGLGKTIEAGLIWTELRSRFDYKRLLVVCPAMLREKWRSELLNRFGFEPQIASATDVKRNFELVQSGKKQDFSMVASMQGLSPRRNWESDEATDASSNLARYIESGLNEFDEPIIDLLVIDEAHSMRNMNTTYAKLGKLLRPISSHVLLLTATPIHLDSSDLFSLLQFVDEDTFDHISTFNDILAANEPLVRARQEMGKNSPNLGSILDDLKEARGHPMLSNNRQLTGLIKNITFDSKFVTEIKRAEFKNQLESVNLLSKAITRTRKVDVTEMRVVREAKTEIIKPHIDELAFYEEVTNIVRNYAETKDIHNSFLLATPQRQISSSIPAAMAHWRRDYAKDIDIDELESLIYEDFGIERTIDTDEKPLLNELIRRTSGLGDPEHLRKIDTKYHRLIIELQDFFQEHPDEKVILFATYHATLYYLQGRLSEDDISSMLLIGDQSKDKFSIIEKFRDDQSSQVLLASEVASEGIDLQFSRVIINYDLPWNPMKVEQRIGRVDRIGQKAKKIIIWNLIYQGTIDEKIYNRLYNRLEIFERSLGGLDAILGEEISRLTQILLQGQLTKAQEDEQIKKTAQAIANKRKMETDLENDASGLVAHGDYILNQVHAARDLERWITGDDISIFVRDYLDEHFQGCQFDKISDDEQLYEVKLTSEAKFELSQFVQDNRFVGRTRLLGDSSKPVKCLFDNHVAFEKKITGIEITNQWHPLVKFVSWKLKADDSPYYPLSRTQISKTKVEKVGPGVYAFAINKWSVEGVRTLERLCYVVKPIGTATRFLDDEIAEQLITRVARTGFDPAKAISESSLLSYREALESCLSELDERYKRFVEAITNENYDRADVQKQALKKSYLRQLETKRGTLENHRRAGRVTLVKAFEGQIQKLMERYQFKQQDIKRRRHLHRQSTQLCCGVVEVI